MRLGQMDATRPDGCTVRTNNQHGSKGGRGERKAEIGRNKERQTIGACIQFVRRVVALYIVCVLVRDSSARTRYTVNN